MKSQPSFRVVALDPSLAAAVRATGRDASGRPALRRADAAPHQCRACLELTAPGEPVLLFSHRPFGAEQPYAESGPVFIHERPCAPPADDSIYPRQFPRAHAVLRAYTAADEIADAEVVGNRPVEDVLAALLARPEVAYVHARNDSYGCYMFRVERAA